MGFLDALLGRSKPAPPDLDQLFGLPAAAISLQASTGFRPTGVGSVCFKAAEGGGFIGLQEQVEALLALDQGKYRKERDSFGFTWLIRSRKPSECARSPISTSSTGISSGDRFIRPASPLCWRVFPETRSDVPRPQGWWR